MTDWSDAAAPPRQLWRTSFVAPAASMPGLLEALEEYATGVSIFEEEVGGDQEPLSWRVDLLFDRRPIARELRRQLEAICAPFGFVPETGPMEPVPEQDWLAATAMRAPPVRVGRFFVHGATAADAVPADAVPVQVEAGLAFGSGEHATTQACLEAIDRLATRHRFRRVLDMGCGSAVLAIAAAKRRPCRVLAADNDPVAVRVAAENVAINRVAGRVRCVVSDGLTSPEVRRRAPYDLVLANILADPLIAMAGEVARATAPGGHVVLSGFLDRQVEAVERAYRARAFRRLWRIDRAPWAALVLSTPGR